MAEVPGEQQRIVVVPPPPPPPDDRSAPFRSLAAGGGDNHSRPFQRIQQQHYHPPAVAAPKRIIMLKRPKGYKKDSAASPQLVAEAPLAATTMDNNNTTLSTTCKEGNNKRGGEDDAGMLGVPSGPGKTLEEREREYLEARRRIFGSLENLSHDDSVATSNGNDLFSVNPTSNSTATLMSASLPNSTTATSRPSSPSLHESSLSTSLSTLSSSHQLPQLPTVTSKVRPRSWRPPYSSGLPRPLASRFLRNTNSSPTLSLANPFSDPNAAPTFPLSNPYGDPNADSSGCPSGSFAIPSYATSCNNDNDRIPYCPSSGHQSYTQTPYTASPQQPPGPHQHSFFTFAPGAGGISHPVRVITPPVCIPPVYVGPRGFTPGLNVPRTPSLNSEAFGHSPKIGAADFGGFPFSENSSFGEREAPSSASYSNHMPVLQMAHPAHTASHQLPSIGFISSEINNSTSATSPTEFGSHMPIFGSNAIKKVDRHQHDRDEPEDGNGLSPVYGSGLCQHDDDINDCSVLYSLHPRTGLQPSELEGFRSFPSSSYLSSSYSPPPGATSDEGALEVNTSNTIIINGLEK